MCHFRASMSLLCPAHVFRVPPIFRSRTAFEKNKTDVFRIKTHNVGPLKKLRYWAANWQIGNANNYPEPHSHKHLNAPSLS